MRRLLALLAVVGMLAGAGCVHETCDSCDGPSNCGGCGPGHYTVTAPGVLPAKKAEEIKVPPAPKPEGGAAPDKIGLEE